MKTSNPAFLGTPYAIGGYGPTMTISGTVNKAGILALCVLATAAWSWNQFLTNGPAAVGGYTMIGAFGGFIVPLAYAWSKSQFGSIEPALRFYVAFFLGLLVVTWFCYLRNGKARVGV